MAISAIKTSAACGAAIEFDLSRPVDDANFAEMERLFHDNGEHIGLADAGFTWYSDTSYRRCPSRCSSFDA